MSDLFLMPKSIVSGQDALKESMEHIKGLGKKALIVTDETMVKIGTVSKLEKALNENQIEFFVYDGVNGEPIDEMIDEGKRLYLENNCDFLIATGGGSPIDAMKAIGAMLTNEGNIVDYNGKVIPNPPPNLVAIPTTAGTGSEATKFTIITDSVDNIKMLLVGPDLIPTLSVIDPELTMTAPPTVTAATGVDALTHAIEAFTSRKAQPMSDIFAISAIKRIYNNILPAYEDGNNIESRNEMSLAALEAGIAFSNASVTIVHGMSRPIGALFGIAHGLSNAILLEECLKFIKEGAVEEFAFLARELELVDKNIDDTKAADIFEESIIDLINKLNIQTLEEYGVDKEVFNDSLDKMATDALASGSPGNTQRIPTKEDIIKIYKKLWV
ncbi:MAG TPA: iron-containing alcohol dehydrogenase [Tissierellales bacterium]|nr:iron-containing alcohol dehydrogenase [Tissierellales bacterium]